VRDKWGLVFGSAPQIGLGIVVEYKPLAFVCYFLRWFVALERN